MLRFQYSGRRPFGWLLAGLLAAGSTFAADIPTTHAEVNVQLGLVSSDLVLIDFAAEPGRPMRIDVPIDGAVYTLDLRPHSNRAPGYQLLVVGDDGVATPMKSGAVRTMRGELVGIPGSIVSASIDEAGLTAMIQVDGDRYFIEPLAARIADAEAGEHVVYQSHNVIRDTATCPVEDGGPLDAALHAAELDEWTPPQKYTGEPEMQGSVLCIAELACDADFQYYQGRGSSVTNVENRINSVINAVNAQYEIEVGIRHVITAIIVRTSSGSNPYTSSDAGTLLNQFRNHWQANHGSIPRDVAELFTGRNLNGSTIGIAWLGGVCNSFGYNVVQSDFSGNFSCSTDLSSHELGHNWNAGHCSCPSTTMNPSITCTNTFHPTATIPSIIAFRDSRSCLDCETTGGGQSASISNIIINMDGTIIAGGIPRLQVSDDDRHIVLAGYLASNDRYRANAIIDVQSPIPNPSLISFDVETGTTKLGVTTRIFIWNYSAGQWDKLDDFTQPKDDTTNSYNVSNLGANYANGLGNIRLRVFMFKDGDVFRQRIDYLGMLVYP